MKGKLVPLIITLFFILSCNSEDDSNCEKSNLSDCQGQPKLIVCAQEYQPVCGCNCKTYGNACEAEADGLLAWTAGECN